MGSFVGNSLGSVDGKRLGTKVGCDVGETLG